MLTDEGCWGRNERKGLTAWVSFNTVLFLQVLGQEQV
jgi:hypothetical protein